jgi:hypothetical protein
MMKRSGLSGDMKSLPVRDTGAVTAQRTVEIERTAAELDDACAHRAQRRPLILV